MLAALGMFVFETSTALFDELSRKRQWRHGRSDRFGARAASQYLGPGEDALTLTGRIVPGLAGKYSSIARIAQMADTGDAYPLANGLGDIIGRFTIEGVDEVHKELIDTGQARVVEFTLNLQRAD